MSTSLRLVKQAEVWTPPAVKPLDEAVWQAWLEKGRAQERQSAAARIKAVKWISMGGLFASLGYWPHPAPFDTVVRLVVAAGALAIMFQAFGTSNYALAAVFAGLVVAYNPLVPVFGFSSQWQGALVVASAIPFVASLAWHNPRTEAVVLNKPAFRP